jgi:tetratricopeptide (TPR) repeat protein
MKNSLRNSSKTERGAGKFRVRLVVRAAPFALLKLCLAAVLAAAAIQALRIGFADYLFRTHKVAWIHRAIEIWPRDAQYYAGLADVDPENAAFDLRQAVALNPGLSLGWIKLGLTQEIQGNVAEAERCYLQSARYDRQFLPAWTLASFYARRNDAAHFWPWSRRAAEMSYDNIRPILRQAFGFTENPEVVFDKIVLNSAQERKLEHEFLYYLLEEHLEALPILKRLLSTAGPDDQGVFLAWTNRLLETGRTVEAGALWNGLSDRKVIPYSHVGLLTNPEFSLEPLRAAFDWLISAPPGVVCDRAPGGLRIELSGDQPESFVLASQYLNLTGGSYTLHCEYRTEAIDKTSNLRWSIGPLSSEPMYASEGWRNLDWTFACIPVNRLTLAGQRDPGTVRPEGVLYIRGLRIAPLPAGL